MDPLVAGRESEFLGGSVAVPFAETLVAQQPADILVCHAKPIRPTTLRTGVMSPVESAGVDAAHRREKAVGKKMGGKTIAVEWQQWEIPRELPADLSDPSVLSLHQLWWAALG